MLHLKFVSLIQSENWMKTERLGRLQNDINNQTAGPHSPGQVSTIEERTVPSHGQMT